MILRNRLNYRLLLLPLLLAIMTVAAHAQQNSEIVGTVTDKQGAVVSGAKVYAHPADHRPCQRVRQQRIRLFSFPGLERRHLRPEGHGHRI